MAVAQRRRIKSKAKADAKLTGKESWLIVGEDGIVVREVGYGEGAALSLAQNLMKTFTDPTTLTVQLKALFGEPDSLYRVVRTEDGDVLTYRT